MSIGRAAEQTFAYAALPLARMRDFGNREMPAGRPVLIPRLSGLRLQFQTRHRQKVVVGYLGYARDIAAEKSSKLSAATSSTAARIPLLSS